MNDQALLEGAVALLRDEPPPLDDEGVRALLRAVMERARDEQLADAMADSMRDDTPPLGEDPALLARRAASAATASAATEAAEVETETASVTSDTAMPQTAHVPKPMSWVWPLAAVAVVALGVGLGLQLFSDEDSPSSREPVVHRLSGGHVITATADARLEVDDDGERVRVRLERGEALFEVEPGSDFAVRAGGDLVRVTGTIFTVSNLEGNVGVRVYEGSVRIEGERRAVLGAGEAWRPVRVDVELRTEAARALRRRERQAALPSPPEGPGLLPETLPRPPETTLAPDETEATPEEPLTAQSPRTGRSAGDETALGVAMRALAERRYEDALLLAERATGRGTTFEWEMVRGDAHRGLGRHARAAEVYRGAARSGNREQRAVAGLAGARVLYTSLSRAADARRLLEESGALEPGSPVRLAARQLDAQLGPR